MRLAPSGSPSADRRRSTWPTAKLSNPACFMSRVRPTGNSGWGRCRSIFNYAVPAAGFEPATYGLQNRCTTTVLSRQSARDYNRAGRSAGSGSLDRVVPDRDFAWVSGCGGRSTAAGLRGPESCADDDSLDEATTATPMIKTTSADKVQERRSESSRLCMGILSAPGGYPHCDRDHKLPGSSVKTASALQLRTEPICRIPLNRLAGGGEGEGKFLVGDAQCGRHEGLLCRRRGKLRQALSSTSAKEVTAAARRAITLGDGGAVCHHATTAAASYTASNAANIFWIMGLASCRRRRAPLD
jgi:hypothetical protein